MSDLERFAFLARNVVEKIAEPEANLERVTKAMAMEQERTGQSPWQPEAILWLESIVLESAVREAKVLYWP